MARVILPLSARDEAILRQVLVDHPDGPRGTQCPGWRVCGGPSTGRRPCAVRIAAEDRLRQAGVL